MVTDPLVQKVVRQVTEAVHPMQVIAFGYRVWGVASETSDVDLMVLYDGPQSTREVQRAIHRLFAHPEFSLDVFVMTPKEWERHKRIANTLAREVAERGVVCYG